MRTNAVAHLAAGAETGLGPPWLAAPHRHRDRRPNRLLTCAKDLRFQVSGRTRWPLPQTASWPSPSATARPSRGIPHGEFCLVRRQVLDRERTWGQHEIGTKMRFSSLPSVPGRNRAEWRLYHRNSV